MLVLRRRQYESVVLGDEVTLKVEKILGHDGQHIPRATVRLGFQAPQYVSVYRSELCGEHSGSGTGPEAGPAVPTEPARPAEPARPQPGRVVEIPDAWVQLRILVPRRIPVRCNGTPLAGLDWEAGPDGGKHSSRTMYKVTCRKEERISICNNIVILVCSFHYFLLFEERQPAFCT